MNEIRSEDSSLAGRWLRFLAGSVMLALMVAFFASGYTPPGVCGEVLRHNQAEDIDASPLIYTEVEHMFELEAGVRLMREQAEATQSNQQSAEE